MRIRWLLVVLGLLFGSAACTSLLGNDFEVDGNVGATGGEGNETATGGSTSGGKPASGGGTGGAAASGGTATAVGGSSAGGAPVQIACAMPCAIFHGAAECPAGVCVLTCDMGWLDCDNDKGNGCEANVEIDPNHCGVCATVCTSTNATPVCGKGACALGACLPGWGDCDQSAVNGCEKTLTTVTDCGVCGLVCQNANGGTACTNGVCVPSCSPDWGDCDADPNNGCETSLTANPAHCGACGVACLADELCDANVCKKAALCGSDFKKDCDGEGAGMDANGCETNVAADSSNCGVCGMLCQSNELCLGSCFACPAGTLDCNKGTDGCETLQSPLQCGACSQSCGSDGTCGCGAGVCSGGTVYFSEDFSDNSRAWALEQEWEIGPTFESPALVATWEYGNLDPAMDHSASTDNGVAALGVGKNIQYKRVHGLEYLTSPLIPLPSGPATMYLTFQSWLNLDEKTWTHVTVEVFDGVQWKLKWENGDEVTTETTWNRKEISVAKESNPSFRVRFGFSSTSALNANGKNVFPWLTSGWNVDDVTVSSATCL